VRDQLVTEPDTSSTAWPRRRRHALDPGDDAESGPDCRSFRLGLGLDQYVVVSDHGFSHSTFGST